MRTFILKVKQWLESCKKYIWIAVIVYVIHLCVEGLIVNLIWYNVIKPVGGITWAL